MVVNPFADFNANLMEDEDIIKYWITPGPLSDMIDCGSVVPSSPPIFFMGGRGSGKTMILKYMSNDIQIKKSISEGNPKEIFFNNFHFIGIYYRFDGPSLSSFQDRNIGEIQWETIFKHYFDIVICQKYIQMLINLRDNNYLELTETQNKILITELDQCIFSSDGHDISEFSLEFILKKLESSSKIIFNFINHAVFNEKPLFRADPIFSSGELIFNIPLIISKRIPELKRKKFVVLLDEYENATKQQQLIINTLVKHVKPPVTFLIGSRYYGIKTYDTLNKGEFLLEDADFRKISFEKIVNTSTYLSLIKQVANRRLETADVFFKENKIQDIEKILGYFSPTDEAKKIIFKKWAFDERNIEFDQYKKLSHINELKKEIALKIKNVDEKILDQNVQKLISPSNPLIDVLNIVLLRRGNFQISTIQHMTKIFISEEMTDPHYKIYKELYEKNKIALIFHLLSFYPPTQKEYGGFRIYAMLSSGLIRNFLELGYQSFKNSLFSDPEEFKKLQFISYDLQTKAANSRSEKFFNSLENIPNYGNEIRSLVLSLGAIFSSWYTDPRISEPEPTYFCIDKTALSSKTQEVLNTAVQWSVLQQKEPMRGKTPGDPLLDVYVLNRILAPKFSISYRSRGRIPQFTPADMETLIFGNSDEKQKITKDLSKRSFEQYQSSLLEYIG